MANMSDREAIRIALYDAIEWQRGLVRAYSHIPEAPEHADALAMVKRYKAILRKRYGAGRHAGQSRVESARLVSLHEILAKHES